MPPPFLCPALWKGAAIYVNEDDVFVHKRDVIVLKCEKTRKFPLEIPLIGFYGQLRKTAY